MKTLILVRHAKSSWDTPGIDDFDRPLNDRGKKDAPEMAKRLRKKVKDIDIFLSSPAKRACKTAKLFIEEFGGEKKDIVLMNELYHAETNAFEKVVSTIKDKHKSAIIFSHNPGITSFVNTLTNVHIDDMPTCSIFAVQLHINNWSALANCQKSFLFFDYPKNQLA